MNYLIVINKNNLISDSYYKLIELVECKDVLNENIKVEKETYEAYLKLKEYLKEENISIEIDSAYRSIEEQQEIIDDYTKKYGQDYVEKYVAPIRTSEHHTGLAIDLALIINDVKYYNPEDLFEREEIFLTIHKHLSKFGFILRYPKNKENITGYNYEPWHIRYVGVKDATIIDNKNITLEEYTNKNID